MLSYLNGFPHYDSKTALANLDRFVISDSQTNMWNSKAITFAQLKTIISGSVESVNGYSGIVTLGFADLDDIPTPEESSSFLSWNGSDYVWAIGGVGETNLSDNIISGSSIGLFKEKTGVTFYFRSILGNNGIETLLDDDVVKFNFDPSTLTELQKTDFINSLDFTGAISLEQLSSVLIDSPAEEQVLTYIGGKWVNRSVTSLSSFNINDLSAVTTADNAVDYIAIYSAGLAAQRKITVSNLLTLAGFTGDVYFKISPTDDTNGYASTKLIAGDGLKRVVNNPSGSETMTFSLDIANLTTVTAPNASSYFAVLDGVNYKKTSLQNFADTLNVQRITAPGVAGENIDSGNIVYLKSTDNKWYKADASVVGTSENILLGVSQDTTEADATMANGVLLYGIDTRQTSLTENKLYYLSDTAGAISLTEGTVSVKIGFSYSASSILFCPRYDALMTKNLLSACAGSHGTPGEENVFVTTTDPRYVGLSECLTGRAIAGENLVVGDSVFIEQKPTNNGLLSVQNLGDTSANTRISFKRFGSGVAGNTLGLYLEKVGSPEVFAQVRIETDNAGSPSGTLVDADAEITIDPTSIVSGPNANTHGYSMSNYGSDANAYGVKITPVSASGVITSVTKEASCTATQALLRSSTGTILSTATFSGNVATFSTPYQLVYGTYYRVELYNNGSNYQSRYAGPSMPHTVSSPAGNITYVSGSANGGDSTSFILNIAGISFNYSTSITVTFPGSFTIDEGTPVHVVVSKVGDSTNGVNYYKLGYGSNHSTAQYDKHWNGSVWGATNNRLYFEYSTLLSSEVLSKTDSDYSYKLPVYYPMIMNQEGSVGEILSYDYFGNSGSVTTSSAPGTELYLGATPGSIVTTAGTNYFRIGVVIGTNSVLLYKQTVITGTDSTSYVVDTIYRAAVDGFLNVYATISSNYDYVSLLTDSAAIPATTVMSCMVHSSYNSRGGFMYPIKKGDYFKVTRSTSYSSLTLRFIKL